ncbi:non-specific lipid transfer protein GPI-anchored 5-like isoform X2 [Malania oleifera]|uniref:non-specific lipid transfer protein GPI-anchored 5-like isoform X2 n=1 Tax=Malania oleifera TaxID=397392 RepID=UPI0025ADC3EF|nr:non-specific lipid transfer protein GPI-anchored 5-like isoform X2 [Malania oleifera]
MASKAIEMCLVLILMTMLCGGATAQSSCTSVIMGLSPCLNYITGNSSTPSPSCCSQLTAAIQSQPQCLCSLLNGGGMSLGIPINQTLALALPGACNVQTPPISQCNAASGPTTPAAPPVDSPIGSPVGSSNETPADTPSASDVPNPSGGSKTVPSTKGNTSGGSIILSPFRFVILLLFIGSTGNHIMSFLQYH